jgi:hypothetical protein
MGADRATIVCPPLVAHAGNSVEVAWTYLRGLGIFGDSYVCLNQSQIDQLLSDPITSATSRIFNASSDTQNNRWMQTSPLEDK